MSDEQEYARSGVFSGAQRATQYREGGGGTAAPFQAPQRPVKPVAAPETSTPALGASTAPAAAPVAPADAPAKVGTPRRADAPAQWGRRGKLVRWSGGLLKFAPTAAELAHREAVMVVRQTTWTRAVNAVVLNPKGGTGKTPASLILAGILGQIRGGYVVAWEAAESIGSLYRRAEGDPARGLAEMLGGLDEIGSAGNLGGYTAPQTSHADVIGSVSRRANLTASDVIAVRQVLDRYYRITLADTGNNPGHEAFQAAVATADAAVIPCLVSLDALAGVEEALAVLEDAEATDGMGLRSRIVVILGHDGGPEDPDVAAWVQRRLDELGVSAVVEVPFDPAIRAGGEIALGSLSDASTRAWTLAAAELVKALRHARTDVDLVAHATATHTKDQP